MGKLDVPPLATVSSRHTHQASCLMPDVCYKMLSDICLDWSPTFTDLSPQLKYGIAQFFVRH